jgi:ankyrin repeat protein
MQQMAQHEAFLAAVREGDEGQVRSLLQGNPELINACGEAKNTALHIAVLAGASGEVVQCLLGAGADVMARDADGNTALHLASLHPPPDTVVFPHLLSCGGMELLHAANNEGLTALAIAQRANIEWLVAGLQQHDTVLRAMDSDPWRQLEGALQMLSLESFERKVGERGGVNARAFDTGETPLMLALSCGRVDLAQWLVEQGADIHATTRATEKGPATPCLVFALGRPDALRFMLAHGADPLAQLGPNGDVLTVAASSASAQAVELLLDAIATRIRDRHDIGSAVCCSLLANNLSATRALLAWQSGQLRQDHLDFGLIAAVRLASYDVVASLLERGANVFGRRADWNAVVEHCLDTEIKALLLSHSTSRGNVARRPKD